MKKEIKSRKIKEMNKSKITLEKIAEWSNKVNKLQEKKADLEKEILIIDLKLHKIMLEYEELCKKLLTNIK